MAAQLGARNLGENARVQQFFSFYPTLTEAERAA